MAAFQVQVVNKYGGRIYKTGDVQPKLESWVNRLLGACMGDLYSVGLKRGDGLTFRVELQYSPRTANNTENFTRGGYFRSRVDHALVPLASFPHKIVVLMSSAPYWGDVARIMAHEFGHACDYLDNPRLYTLRSRQGGKRILEDIACAYAEKKVSEFRPKSSS